MTTYRERRQARAERLDQWAAGRAAKADATLTRAHEMADAIPLGQPILAGHYSQNRDQRYRERMRNTVTRGIEHQRKAESMASRADGIRSQLATSIYSDDPDAVPALTAKLARLETERADYKTFNAAARKLKLPRDVADWTPEQRAAIAAIADAAPAKVRRGGRQIVKACPYQLRNGALPAYASSNLTGRIGEIRKRIERLTATTTTDNQ